MTPPPRIDPRARVLLMGIAAAMLVMVMGDGATRYLALFAVVTWGAVLAWRMTPRPQVARDGSYRWTLRRRAVEYEPPTKLGEALVGIAGNQPMLTDGDLYFVVDTGAQLSAITPFGLAKRGAAGVPLLRDLRGLHLHGFGTGSPPLARRAELLDVRFGELHFPRVTASKIEGPFDALLGLPQLFGHVLCLDLQRHRLSLHASLESVRTAHSWMVKAEPAPLLGDEARLAVTGRLDGADVEITIDTGADFTAVRHGVPEDSLAAPGSHGVQGPTGTRSVTAAGSLQLGSAVFAPGLAVLEGTLQAGVNLGADRLWGRVLVVDPDRREIWISPPGKRPAQALRLEDLQG